MTKNTFMILYESTYHSIQSNILTFGCLLGMFWVNKEYLGSAVPTSVLTAFFIFFIIARVFNVMSKAPKFSNYDDAHEYIKDIYNIQDEDKPQ